MRNPRNWRWPPWNWAWKRIELFAKKDWDFGRVVSQHPFFLDLGWNAVLLNRDLPFWQISLFLANLLILVLVNMLSQLTLCNNFRTLSIAARAYKLQLGASPKRAQLPFQSLKLPFLTGEMWPLPIPPHPNPSKWETFGKTRGKPTHRQALLVACLYCEDLEAKMLLDVCRVPMPVFWGQGGGEKSLGVCSLPGKGGFAQAGPWWDFGVGWFFGGMRLWCRRQLRSIATAWYEIERFWFLVFTVFSHFLPFWTPPC